VWRVVCLFLRVLIVVRVVLVVVFVGLVVVGVLFVFLLMLLVVVVVVFVLLVLVVILLMLLVVVVVVLVLFVLLVILLMLLMIVLILERHHALKWLQLKTGGLERLGQVKQAVRVLENRVGVRCFEAGAVDDYQVSVGNRADVVNGELQRVGVRARRHQRSHVDQIAPDLTHPVSDHLVGHHNRDRFDWLFRRVSALFLLLLRLCDRGLRLCLLLRLLIVGAADDECRRQGQRDQGAQRQPEQPGHRRVDLGGQGLTASGPSAGP